MNSSKNRPPRPQLRPAPIGYEDADRGQVAPAAVNVVNDAWQARRFPLVIQGATGVGKTYLAALLYMARATSSEMPTVPLWHRADDLLLSLATSRGDSSQITLECHDETKAKQRRTITRAKYLNSVTRTCCLFLDDLGVRSPTEAMTEALFSLLEMRKSRPVVITTNLSRPELAQIYDDRICSRLAAGTMLLLEGKDRRQGQGRTVRVKT